MIKFLLFNVVLFLFPVLSLTVSAQAPSGSNPNLKRDNSWISISGRAISPREESFTLDYGQGSITVEIGDADTGDAIAAGMPVTVYGRIDEKLFSEDAIEASSIYLEDPDRYIYASAAEEKADTYAPWPATSPGRQDRATIRGVVSRVNSGAGEFVVDRGKKQITIDTKALGYNPMDERGFQKIESGDTVSVSGSFNPKFLEARILIADRIVSLRDPDDDSSRVAMPSVTN